MLRLARRPSSVKHLRQSLASRRSSYHDESYGFRKPRNFLLPDCAFSLHFPFGARPWCVRRRRPMKENGVHVG